MLIVADVVAWPFYRVFGLRLLRATWINTDRLWAGALITVGAIELAAQLL
jgi:hypothetical protein